MIERFQELYLYLKNNGYTEDAQRIQEIIEEIPTGLSNTSKKRAIAMCNPRYLGDYNIKEFASMAEWWNFLANIASLVKENECRDKIISSTADIVQMLNKKILHGAKVPHSTSQPLLYEEDETYYLAVFVFFYTREDIQAGMVDRPTIWAIADLATGEIIKEYQCKEKEFSKAPYDKKYSVRSDAKYDTSKQYYEDAFAKLDVVRKQLIETGAIDLATYQEYLEKIVANIPQEYQRFYKELSI